MNKGLAIIVDRHIDYLRVFGAGGGVERLHHFTTCFSLAEINIPLHLITALIFILLPSYYCPSVANAPNVLQPYWFIVLPLDFPDLTASLLL